MIAHNNEAGFLAHFADLMTALRHCELDAQLIVVDNSDEQSKLVPDAVLDNGTFDAEYHSQLHNLLYGPSMNLAVSNAVHPRLLYICANHGESRDPSWPLDLLAPLEDERVAMAGTLYPTGPPENLGFAADLPPIHVQGGVFAARTAALRENPYPDGEYAHWGSDVYQGLRLQAEGWKLVDVPTIRSVWREDPGEGEWKYVHRGGG
jgi:hypothetical protein